MAEVGKIRYEMEDLLFVMSNMHPENLIRYKTSKGDNKLLPKKKADMLQRWNDIQGRRLPHVSLYIYDEWFEGDARDNDQDVNDNDDATNTNNKENKHNKGNDIIAYFACGSE